MEEGKKLLIEMSTSIRNNINLLDLLVTNRLGERKSTTHLALTTNSVPNGFSFITKSERES